MCACQSSDPTTQLQHSFYQWGKCTLKRHSARIQPRQDAEWFHNSVVLIRTLEEPFHWATWLFDKWSEGFDWLGTLSSHICHEYFSSRRYICLRSLLHGSFSDQFLRKLPLTDSLSEKATTLKSQAFKFWKPKIGGGQQSQHL